jgi:hypothetical protein
MPSRLTKQRRHRLLLFAATASVLVFFTSHEMRAEEYVRSRPNDPNNTLITVNPLDLINGTFNIELEHAVTRDISLFGGVNFLLVPPMIADPGGDLFGVGPTFGLRWFMFGAAPQGIFIGPYVDLDYLNTDKEDKFGYAVGGMIGFSLVALDVLALSLGAGLGFQDSAVDTDKDGKYDIGIYGASPRFRFAVGFAF